MKISQGLSEDGIVIGNNYDKYNSNNPIVKIIMSGFENTLLKLVAIANPQTIHEVGCGEGYWVIRWLEQGLQARGSDFSSKVIDLAKTNARKYKQSEAAFEQNSIYDLSPIHDLADLIICCEVLEHLDEPENALKVLSNITNNYIILSVPREPIWSLLNLVRGKYWSDLGNTPGHIQNWSQRSFIQLVSKYFEIQQVCSPLPWTMLLCKTKK